jgi:hypothetical protein
VGRAGIHYAELAFLQPVRFAGHVRHSDASSVQNVDALFFMLGWDRCCFHKKRAWTHCAELVFLLPMGSASYVVQSVAYGQKISMHYF